MSGEAGNGTSPGFDWEREAADLLQVLRDGVIIADAATNQIVAWNPAAEQIFGYPRDEAIGMTVSQLAPPHLRARHEAGLGRYAQTGEGHFLDHHDPLELPALTKSGEEIIVEFQLTPIRQAHDGRLYAAAIVRDVTDRVHEAEASRKLQEAAAASQRLEAVGQLATGVAHDFNNLLTVILGQIGFLLDGGNIDATDRQALESVMAAAERGSSLSRQLLAFSRKSVVSPTAVSLNDAVMSATQFLSRTLGPNIELKLDLAPVLPRTMMDPTQVDQVLTNLALNARDAMPSGGVLSITTSVVTIPADQRTEDHEHVQPGLYASLSVEDSGVGMDPEVKRRVFEPFFTTKPRERGTGMGLAVVYGIVRQASGHITCESSPGEGTRFRLLIPAVAVETSASPEAPVPEPVAAGKGATILVVDDDPALLQTVKRILERGGHRVIALDAPAEALRIADEGQRFDLLVSDVVMPGLNGPELAAALRSKQVVEPVLLMSGYPEGAVSEVGKLDEDMAFLPKPFRADELLRRVSDLLDSTGGG